MPWRSVRVGRTMLVLAALSAALACSTARTRGQELETRSDSMRAALGDAIQDPVRRTELSQSITGLQVEVQSGLEETARLNHVFVDRSAIHDIERSDLAPIASQIGNARRGALRAMVRNRVALRRAMTAEEWQRFIVALRDREEDAR